MRDAAHFFQALGDETRLALLLRLRDGQRTVGELVDSLGCPQPKVSRHLKVLRDVGLVRDRKEGRHVRYALTRARAWGEEPRRWLELLDSGMASPRMVPSRIPEPARPPAPPRSREPRDLETHLL